MSEHDLAREICRVGRSLFERGYAHATAGNISARLDDGYLITPTDACLGWLEPDRLARVSPEGRHLGGDAPSKTLALHRRIYEADPAARCVIHTHSTHLVALTLLGAWSADDIVPPITPYFVMKVGHVPLIAYRRPGDPQAGEQVARVIRERQSAGRPPLHAVMLERLGPNVWHESPASAMATLEELEETAKLWLLSGRSATPLPEEALAELVTTFRAPW